MGPKMNDMSLTTVEEQAAAPASPATRLEVMAQLGTMLPENDFGMPILVYRPDGIPENFAALTPHQQVTIQNQAAIPLSYSEGFPTMPEGTLFWEQLAFEGGAEFALFQQYLQMSDTYGFRSIQLLARALTDRQIQAARKPVTTPAEPNNPYMVPAATAEGLDFEACRALYENTLSHLNELLVYHYWAPRAKAFDLVGQAAAKRIRNKRAMALEEENFVSFNRMASRITARFDRFTDDQLDAMTPVETVRVLKEVIQMQRVTVGLPAAGPAEQHLPGSGQNQGMEVTLRTIAKQNPKEGLDTSSLLDDEATAATAQELIIRMMQARRS